MTLEEAKEILKKEGWTKFQKLAYRPKGLKRPEWEKPTVVEALEVCYATNVLPLILKEKLSERDERLKAEYENDYGIGQVDCKDGEPARDEHLNHALKESAKQFNESLLDEQSKKIKDLEKKNIILNEKVVTMSKELGAERCTSKILIEKFNEIRSLKKKLRKMRSIADGFRKEINTLTSRIIDFRKSIKEKDEVIEDISEELRLSKEREEELVETVKDYLALVGDKDEEIKKLKVQLVKAKYAYPEFPKPDIVVVKAPF